MELRRFPPLLADHPAVGTPCWICGAPIHASDETTLVPKEPPPDDGRVHTVEAGICHWRCVKAGQSDWTAPCAAVEPANHFHTLYMRLAAISEALIRQASSREDVLKNPVWGELLGSIAEISNLAAKMTTRLEGIRRDFPKLWEMWQHATRYEPPNEDRSEF